jgi:hypothetical protein
MLVILATVRFIYLRLHVDAWASSLSVLSSMLRNARLFETWTASPMWVGEETKWCIIPMLTPPPPSCRRKIASSDHESAEAYCAGRLPFVLEIAREKSIVSSSCQGVSSIVIISRV